MVIRCPHISHELPKDGTSSVCPYCNNTGLIVIRPFNPNIDER